MDPLTHALAGVLTASFSGEPMSITNPILLGALLGSMAPDLDIVYQTKGDVAYLKNHRGFNRVCCYLSWYSWFSKFDISRNGLFDDIFVDFSWNINTWFFRFS